MKKNSILFITNGNITIGFGHIARDIVIAKEFANNGWNVQFLLPEDSIFVNDIKQLFNEKVYTIPLFSKKAIYSTIKKIVNNYNVKVIFVDLIEREYNSLSWLKEDFPNILLVSMTLFLFPLDKRYEDISFFPDMKEYKFDDSFKLFSGPSYFVFRDEFKNIKKNQRKIGDKILISMGGTDPYGITLQVLQGLITSEYNITVILSEYSPSFAYVNTMLQIHKCKVKLISFTNNIAKEMERHDIVIINGGMTRYEACIALTPFIAISINETQYNITKQLTDVGVGINLGIYKNLNSEDINYAVSTLLSNYSQRYEMSKIMKNLFRTDGHQKIYSSIINNIKYSDSDSK